MSDETRSIVRAVWSLDKDISVILDIVTAPFGGDLFHRYAGLPGDDSRRKSCLRRWVSFSAACVGVVPIFCLLSPPALANGVLLPELVGSIYSDGPRLASLDVASVALAFIAALLFSATGWRLGPLGDGVALGYIACGIALLGMTRVFYLLAGTGVIPIHGDTLEIWSHTIYCVAMAVSICGGRALSKHGSKERRLASRQWFVRIGTLSGLATVAIFVMAKPLDEPFMAVFHDSFLDRFPTEHFVAFVLGAVALIYMIQSVDIDESLSGASKNAVLIFPLMLGYFLFSLEHLWELLLDLLHITAVHSTTMAERVEQMIILAGFLIVTYSGWRLWSVTRNHGGQQVRW